MGVIHAIQAFLPHIKTHGEGGHTVNTSSIVAWGTAPGIGPYTATKCAIVGLSETLALELAGTAIAVTVVSPGATRTRIAESSRNRPHRFGARHDVAEAAMEQLAAFIRAGIDPKEVARRVTTAIRDNDLYVFTHLQDREFVEERFRRILSAFDKSAAGSKLKQSVRVSMTRRRRARSDQRQKQQRKGGIRPRSIRTVGEIALMSPQLNAGKAKLISRALAIARKKQTKSWELRAAMSMARVWRDQRKRQQGHDLLAPVHGWFTEGFDTLDLKEAKALE